MHQAHSKPGNRSDQRRMRSNAASPHKLLACLCRRQLQGVPGNNEPHINSTTKAVAEVLCTCMLRLWPRPDALARVSPCLSHGITKPGWEISDLNVVTLARWASDGNFNRKCMPNFRIAIFCDTNTLSSQLHFATVESVLGEYHIM